MCVPPKPPPPLASANWEIRAFPGNFVSANGDRKGLLCVAGSQEPLPPSCCRVSRRIVYVIYAAGYLHTKDTLLTLQ